MKTYTGSAGIRANCSDCGWQCFANNAMGVAAQHAKRYKHKVIVEAVRIVRFEGAEQPA